MNHCSGGSNAFYRTQTENVRSFFFFLQEFLHIVDKIVYCLIPLLISARMCAIFFLFFLFSVWVVNDIQEIFSVSLYLSLKPV